MQVNKCNKNKQDSSHYQILIITIHKFYRYDVIKSLIFIITNYLFLFKMLISIDYIFIKKSWFKCQVFKNFLKLKNPKFIRKTY